MTEGSGNPDRLFHGSPKHGIRELKPHAKKKRHEGEGEVIFATPNKAAAMKNLMFSDDSWTALAGLNNTEVALIAMNRDQFVKQDKGGSCYELPGEGFVCETKYGGGSNEWTSRQKVKPLSEERFPSALDAMIQHGVQVYFVQHADLQAFDEAEDKVAFLRERVSENEQRGAPKPEYEYRSKE